jgi:hypothetical protein
MTQKTQTKTPNRQAQIKQLLKEVNTAVNEIKDIMKLSFYEIRQNEIDNSIISIKKDDSVFYQAELDVLMKVATKKFRSYWISTYKHGDDTFIKMCISA